MRTARQCPHAVAGACSLVLAPVMLGGCATLPNGRNWGQDATISPGWQRVGESALEAARSPRVWLPLLGAGLLQINGWDRKVSDWARENTPIFGSEESAARWSDDLRTASSIAYHASVLATPDEGPFGNWLESKAKGYAVGLAAVGFTGLTTNGLKSVTARERPNGQDTESFPSGHTSHSAVLTELAQCNLESIRMSDGSHLALDIGLNALTIGTGWARVEAGAHFPSDSLFAMALGNWSGRAFNDAFMGLGGAPQLSLAFMPLEHHGIELRWRVALATH